MKERPANPSRIEPDRRWFGNTRVLSQKQIQNFTNEIDSQV